MGEAVKPQGDVLGTMALLTVLAMDLLVVGWLIWWGGWVTVIYLVFGLVLVAALTLSPLYWADLKKKLANFLSRNQPVAEGHEKE